MAHRHDPVSDPFTSAFIRFKAAQLCRRSDFSRSDRDDLTQGMLLHLVEKASLFDPARGNVEAFVTQVVNTWIAMLLRSRGRDKRRGDIGIASLDELVARPGSDPEPRGACVSDEDLHRRTHGFAVSAAEELERADAVRVAMRKLPPESRELLQFVADHSVAEAGREWSRRTGRTVSRRWVTTRIKEMEQVFLDAGLGPR